MTHQAGARLRIALGERRAMIVPGVMNALAARIAEDEGFEALYLTGAGVSNASLGKPDLGFIDLTQLCMHAASVREVTDLPLIVDADTGFGNAVNVYHTVRMLERAGATAIQIEDQSMPKRCGHFDGKSIIGTDEMVQKVRAAVDGRRSDDLLVVARTDAYATEGLAGAIERAERFIEAGADVTFVEAPGDPREFAEICGRLSVPQIANLVIGGKTPPISAAELARAGVGMVLYANAALQGAMLGMQGALRLLKAEGQLDEASGVVISFSERQRLVGKTAIDAQERTYSTAG